MNGKKRDENAFKLCEYDRHKSNRAKQRANTTNIHLSQEATSLLASRSAIFGLTECLLLKIESYRPNHVKIFKGWPPRDAPSKLVQLWYFHLTSVVRQKWNTQLD